MYRVVFHEKTEWADYFVIVDENDKIVSGPTFYRRMVEQCAALSSQESQRSERS